MATELDKLIVRFQAHFDDLRQGFRQVENLAVTTTKKIQERFARMGDSLVASGQNLTGKLTLPLVAMGLAAVKTASDIEEASSLLRVTFGENTRAIEEWSEATGKAMGRSRFELQRFAGAFASFLKPAGMAAPLLVPLSKALAQLVEDIAAFRNMAEGDVLVKLLSGLAGETEAVKLLGINLRETAMKEEAHRMGLKKKVDALSEAERIMLRFNIITRQTADAQGAAARESTTLGGMFRKLGATALDLANEFGQRLIPTAKLLVGGIIAVGQAFLAMSPAAKGTAVAIATVAATVGPALIALGLLSKGVALAVGGLILFHGAVVKAGAAVAATFAMMMTPFGAAIAGMTAGFATGIASLILFKNTTQELFSGLMDFLAVTVVAGFTNRIHRPLAQAVNRLIETLPKGFTEAYNKVASAMNVVREKVPAALRSMLPGGGITLPELKLIPSKVEVPEEVVASVEDTLKMAMRRIAEATAKDVTNIQGAWEVGLTALKAVGAKAAEIMPKGTFDPIIGLFAQIDPLSEGASESIAKLAAEAMDLWNKLMGAGQAGEEGLGKISDSAKEAEESLRKAAEHVEDVMGKFKTVYESVRTPAEELADTKAELEGLRSELEGIGVEGAEIDEVLGRASKAAEKKFKDAENELRKQSATMKDLKEISRDAGRAIADGFGEAILQGKKFGDVISDIGDKILEAFVTKAIMAPIGNLFGGMFGGLFGSAKGNVFMGGQPKPFAKGGVVNSPTVFPMTNGTGIMGEAGKPEGIFPLYRTSSGELGVKGFGGAGSAGGGGRVVVNIYAPPGSTARQEQQQTGDMTRLNVMIDAAVAQNLSNPSSRTSRIMKNNFGIQQGLGGR